MYHETRPEFSLASTAAQVRWIKLLFTSLGVDLLTLAGGYFLPLRTEGAVHDPTSILGG